MRKKATIFALIYFLAAFNAGMAIDKTLVAWVSLNNKSVTGGSVLTLQKGGQYDGIILSAEHGTHWMAGSDQIRRTDEYLNLKTGSILHSVDHMWPIAIVYKKNEIRIYQNNELLMKYSANNIDLLDSEENFVVFGLDHYGGGEFVEAAIDDARIYDRALSYDELRELKPNQESPLKPYAWWDFEQDKLMEKTGRFSFHNLVEGEDVELKDGKLVLQKWGSVIALRPYKTETPEWPENPPDNWLTFHLAHPGPGPADPGDPNPAYFYKERYHLHYIYNSLYGFAYAHVSSKDMLHWKWHPTVLIPPNMGHGMYSGTGFFTSDGQPAMIYHGIGSGRNQISYAQDDLLNKWSEPEVIEPLDENGNLPDIRHWDPDIWQMDGIYYALSGGEDPELMKSNDLKDWQYLGKLLHEDFPDNLGVKRDEDISCANMFKIGNKWMLLCISHRLGCRYYLGDFKEEKFLADSHHLMNWIETEWEGGPGGLVYFAPETMVAQDGRRVMWTWLITEAAPSGIQAIPRELELPDDGILRIRPLKELEKLRYDEIAISDLQVTNDEPVPLDKITGDALEIQLNIASPLPDSFGLNLLADESGNDSLLITFGKGKKEIQIGAINPPFDLMEDEDLTFRIFIDKNLVEIFINDRQAAAVAHSHIRKNPNINLFTKDNELVVKTVKAWKMKTIY